MKHNMDKSKDKNIKSDASNNSEEQTDTGVDLSRRKMGKAALAVTAAGIFAGLSQSGVNVISDAQAGNEKFACWGINSCKGTTDCTTAFNSCNNKNDCKGKGFVNVASAEVCKEKGGVPLKGSKGDPKKS